MFGFDGKLPSTTVLFSWRKAKICQKWFDFFPIQDFDEDVEYVQVRIHIEKLGRTILKKLFEEMRFEADVF